MANYKYIAKEDTAALLSKIKSDFAKKDQVYAKSDIDTYLVSKADIANVYAKTDIYTKAETESLISSSISNLAIADSVYTKAEISSIIAENTTDLALKSETYTKEETNSAISTAIASAAIGDIDLSECYKKPSDGIPTTDLSSNVQSCLNLASTAVQPAALANYATVSSIPTGALASKDMITSTELDNSLSTIINNKAEQASLTAYETSNDASVSKNSSNIASLTTDITSIKTTIPSVCTEVTSGATGYITADLLISYIDSFDGDKVAY